MASATRATKAGPEEVRSQESIELGFRELQHFAHIGEQLPYLVPLLLFNPLTPGQSRQTGAHQRRGIGHRPDTAMRRKQALQPRQRHPCQHRDQQWLTHDGSSSCGNGVQLLRLHRKQLHRCRPDLLTRRIVGTHQTDSSGQSLTTLLKGAGTPNHSQKLVGPNPPTLQERDNKSLGHATQADHTESGLHGELQRAAAPQAGEGALEDSSASATSTSRLTTVGAEASS